VKHKIQSTLIHFFFFFLVLLFLNVFGEEREKGEREAGANLAVSGPDTRRFVSRSRNLLRPSRLRGEHHHLTLPGAPPDLVLKKVLPSRHSRDPPPAATRGPGPISSSNNFARQLQKEGRPAGPSWIVEVHRQQRKGRPAVQPPPPTPNQAAPPPDTRAATTEDTDDSPDRQHMILEAGGPHSVLSLAPSRASP
jgi:hypothetical protein